MKKLTGWWKVAIFCGAARLAGADAVGGANQVNSPILPPGQRPKVIGLHAVQGKPNPKLNSTTTGKNSLNSKFTEEEGLSYYFKHADSGHKMVNGQKESLKAGGKTITKINGPQEGKHNQKTVKTAGKETLVNYSEGDPDKPIVTGQTGNRAVTTGK